MTDLRIGPFSDGIDNVSKDAGLRPSALRTCIDMDIEREGWPGTRAGQTLASAVAGVHSLWSDGAQLYGAVGNSLVSIGGDYARTTLTTLPSTGPVSFSSGPDRIYYSQSSVVGQIRDGVAREVGAPDGMIVSALPGATGGLPVGQYAVALAFVGPAGEEGGLSGIASVAVADGGGIALTLAWPAGASSAIVYRSGAGGDVLYRCATVPIGMTSYSVGVGTLGGAASTHYMRRPPGGHIVRWWKGRLLIARGDTLWYTEPFRTHLCKPATAFVRFPARIRMVEGVDGGVWVASNSVQFLAGADPAQWSPTTPAAALPVPGCSAVADSSLFDGELGLGPSACAVWFGGRGFALGSATGQLIEPRAKTFKFTGQPRSGFLVVHDRRITAFLQS